MATMVVRSAGLNTRQHAAGSGVRRCSEASGIKAGVPAIVHEVLASPGQALDPATRAYMEPRFGFNFCNVRIHQDAQAAKSARSLDALAYTVGRDVVFGNQQYAPGELRGRELLAHELTHVVQQHGAPAPILQRKVQVGAGLKLDTMGYTTTKTGDVYTAPKVMKKGPVRDETFTSLLASPRTFVLAGTTDAEVSSNLKEHIEARLGVIAFASKREYSFATGDKFRMNRKYWSWNWIKGPYVKPGVDEKEALNDLNENPQEYAIACEAAAAFTVKGGGQSSYISGFSADQEDWVPGDWGYIRNTKFSNKLDIGQAGENIIYVGDDKFWGHTKSKKMYRTLKGWLAKVKEWGGANLEETRKHPSKGLVS